MEQSALEQMPVGMLEPQIEALPTMPQQPAPSTMCSSQDVVERHCSDSNVMFIRGQIFAFPGSAIIIPRQIDIFYICQGPVTLICYSVIHKKGCFHYSSQMPVFLWNLFHLIRMKLLSLRMEFLTITVQGTTDWERRLCD